MGEFAAVQLLKLLQISDVFRLVREGVGMRPRPGDRGDVALVLGPARAACEGCCRRYEDCRKCRKKNEKPQRYPMWQGTQSSFREMLKVCCLLDARKCRTRIGPSIRRHVRFVSAIASQPRKDWIADQEGKSLRNRLSTAQHCLPSWVIRKHSRTRLSLAVSLADEYRLVRLA